MTTQEQTNEPLEREASLEALLMRYVERFGENFPMYLCQGTDEADLRARIVEALRTGKPFKPKTLKDALY